MIRQKISQAEINLYFDMLAGLDWHPLFLVLVVVDDGDQAIERARATLLAMGNQGYPDWRLLLIGDDSTVALRDRLVDGCDDVRTLRDRLLNRAADWEQLAARVLDGLDGLRERVGVLPLRRRDRLDRLAALARALPRCRSCGRSHAVLYNFCRPHTSLGGLAPNEFAARSQTDHNQNGCW